MIDEKKGCRILITTRKMEVVNAFVGHLLLLKFMNWDA
jgi:hypothetical protein